MAKLSMMEQMKLFAVKQVLSYVDRDPENNLPRLIDMIQSGDAAEKMGVPGIDKIKVRLGNRQSGWYRLLLSLWTDVDGRIRNRIFENIMANSSGLGGDIPWAEIRISGEGKAEDANVKTGQGKFMLLVRPEGNQLSAEPVFDLAKKYPGCILAAFLKGELVDEDVCGRILEAENVIPVIDLEEKGAEEAMARLRDRKVLFGAAGRYSGEEAEMISSEDFAERMAVAGARAVWLSSREGTDPEVTDAVRERVKEHTEKWPVIIFEGSGRIVV